MNFTLSPCYHCMFLKTVTLTKTADFSKLETYQDYLYASVLVTDTNVTPTLPVCS